MRGSMWVRNRWSGEKGTLGDLTCGAILQGFQNGSRLGGWREKNGLALVCLVLFVGCLDRHGFVMRVRGARMSY